MIRHIVFIRFHASASQMQIEAVRHAFLTLPQQIVGVLDVEWGQNDSPENKNAGFSHCVLMTFADDAARRRYLPHPAHEALKAIFSPVLKDIIVLDYILAATQSLFKD
ncbi:Dabb family protein [Serratia marcescens]